jgi:PAS domain-containing protein
VNDSHTVATIGFEGAPVALCVTRQRVIAGCNLAIAGLFGSRVDEFVGHAMALPYPSRQESHSIGRRGYPRMQQGRRYEDERLMRRRDDELIWCRVSGLTSDAAPMAREAIWALGQIPHAPRSTAMLSPREREVVAQLAAGLTSKENAQLLAMLA